MCLLPQEKNGAAGVFHQGEDEGPVGDENALGVFRFIGETAGVYADNGHSSGFGAFLVHLEVQLLCNHVDEEVLRGVRLEHIVEVGLLGVEGQ